MANEKIIEIVYSGEAGVMVYIALTGNPPTRVYKEHTAWQGIPGFSNVGQTKYKKRVYHKDGEYFIKKSNKKFSAQHVSGDYLNLFQYEDIYKQEYWAWETIKNIAEIKNSTPEDQILLIEKFIRQKTNLDLVENIFEQWSQENELSLETIKKIEELAEKQNLEYLSMVASVHLQAS